LDGVNHHLALLSDTARLRPTLKKEKGQQSHKYSVLVCEQTRAFVLASLWMTMGSGIREASLEMRVEKEFLFCCDSALATCFGYSREKNESTRFFGSFKQESGYAE
jgi:hypothetical protein